MIFIPKKFKKVRSVNIKPEDLKDFENYVKHLYNDSLIPHPIHLSSGNEDKLIKIFQFISKKDYVFSSWRSHYHALLHGLSPSYLLSQIKNGKSMSICDKNKKFYASSIVAGCIPIALGTAIALKKNNKKNLVWCFIGDMTYLTGIFYEAYNYSKNFDLPLRFVIEDNGLSTNTPTKEAWNINEIKFPNDVIYYKYKRKYPHHGTGKWVLF